MKIYRASDRIPVKIGPITFWIAPLSYGKRSELLAMASRAAEAKNLADNLALAKSTVKACLRGVDGVQAGDGSPFELALDGNGEITDECFNDLMQLEQLPTFVAAASKFVSHSLEEAAAIITEGVEIDLGKTVSTLKKSPSVPCSPPFH